MDIPLHLDKSSADPLYRQLYDQIRGAILAGRLAPGTRLPSSRELAGRLGVGRITVTAAYDRLVAEGYGESRMGAWTAVASSLPDHMVRKLRPERAHPVPTAAVRPLSRHARDFLASANFLIGPRPVVEYDFRYMGAAFPMTEWQRMVSRHWSAFEADQLFALPGQGDLRLREQIANYLRGARAVNCAVEQIVVTSNIEHALDLISHVLLDAADRVLIEDPGTLGSRLLFRAHGARVVPVPVDADGVDPGVVYRLRDQQTRLLYVTPSHQYPTGATLSLPRRLNLLEWAADAGVLIVEDDQNSEYRYGDATLESLQGLDSHGVVIYMGTFRRIVGGAVRVSYLVVPPYLVDAMVSMQSVVDHGPPPSIQSALAELMSSGLFARHQRRLHRVHNARREALLAALREHFGDAVLVGPARAGHHVHVRWPDYPATDELLSAALDAQVGLGPVAQLYVYKPTSDPGVLMFYSGLDEQKIRAGVRRLAAVLAGLPRTNGMS